MLQILKLLVPALIPSWTFFKTIEASPRVQWRWVVDGMPPDAGWQIHRPRPDHVSALAMVRRLFWNPQWNDTLYLASLAERIMTAPTPHSISEIYRDLATHLPQPQAPATKLQFRLLFVSETKGKMLREVTFVADPVPLPVRPA